MHPTTPNLNPPLFFFSSWIVNIELYPPAYSKLHLHLFSLCKTSGSIYRKQTLISHNCTHYHLIQPVRSLQFPSPHTTAWPLPFASMEVAGDRHFTNLPHPLLLGTRLILAFNHATGRYLSMPQRLKGGLGIAFALYCALSKRQPFVIFS